MDLITERVRDESWTPWVSRPAKPDTLSPGCRALADRIHVNTDHTPQEPAMRVYGPADHWSRNPGRTIRQSQLASPKSLDYLRSLQAQCTQAYIEQWTMEAEAGSEAAKGLLAKVTEMDGNIYAPIAAEGMSQADCSTRIDELKATRGALWAKNTELRAAARRPAKKSTERGPAEEGFYVVETGPDAGIYKIQVAVHGSGRPYAKKLVTEGPEAGSWVYAKGMQYKLTPEQTLTRETAAKYGELYGMCVRCGATLTAEDSIERYMGPVCYAKTGA
jgi:hypothetical protein